jgi:hypothetical protein
VSQAARILVEKHSQVFMDFEMRNREILVSLQVLELK